MDINELKIKIFELIADIEDFDALMEYYSEFKEIADRNNTERIKAFQNGISKN